MAETSKNKIYYNDNENSVADVLTDMKKMAESTDEAIEKSKYNDAAIKKSISDVEKKQVEKNTEQDSKIVELQTEKAKLETELKEMQEDFYQNSIRGQASGEYIHVEDSSNCRANLQISGNSEQETRKGYNLLNFKKWKDNNVSWNLGKNIVYGDNYVSGTSEGTDCYSNTVNEQYRFNCEPNTTYTLFYINDNSIMCRPIAFVYDSESKNIQTLELGLSADNIIIRRFTTSSEAEKMAIRLGTNVDGVNFKFSNIMILKGIYDKSTIPNYEQYGAMPSLDYPSEIKAVGDNVNLANLGEKAQYTSSGFTVSWEDSVFKMSGTASTNLTIPANVTGVTNAINLGNFKAGTYTVSKKILNGNVVNAKGSGIYLRSSNGMIASIYIASIKDRASFTLTEDTNIYIYVFIDSGTQYSDLEIGIKIAEGTEVGEYSKFGQGCVKVTKCNENILDTSITKNVKNQNGEERIGYFCRITKTGTYYLMLNTANTLYFGKSTDLNSATTLIGSTSSTFSTTYDFNEGEYFVLWGTKTDTDKIMIMLSNEQQKYIEHQEQSYIMPIQQPMRSIGDIRDTFIKKENKWYERHYVQRLILNGTEGWNYDKNNNRFYFAKAGNKGSGYIMSSHYLRGDTTKQNNTCEIWSSAILFRDERFTEREDFKNMIKAKYDEGIPVYVDYVSITPTDIECTEEQSQILDELTNARTYKNVTNITTDSKAILSLDYVKDLETLLTSKESEV